MTTALGQLLGVALICGNTARHRPLSALMVFMIRTLVRGFTYAETEEELKRYERRHKDHRDIYGQRNS